MRHVPRALLAGGLGLAASFFVACGGGSGLLSSNQAGNLNAQLDQVSSAVQSGDCGGATSALRQFSDAVTHLPGSVNPTLRDNLTQDATRVAQLASRDCHKTTPSTPTSSATTAHTTSTTQSTSTPSTSSATNTQSPPPPTDTNPGGTATNPSTSNPSGSGGAGVGGSGASGGAGAGDGNGNGNNNGNGNGNGK